MEPGVGAGAIAARIDAELPGLASEGGDGAAGGDFANRVVARIGHVEVAGAIDREALGVFEQRGGAGAVGEAGHAAAPGERGH